MVEVQLDFFAVLSLQDPGLLVVVVTGKALVGRAVGEQGVSLPVRIEVDGVLGVVNRGKRGLLALLDGRNLLFDAALLQVFNGQFFALELALVTLGILEDALPKELDREGEHS